MQLSPLQSRLAASLAASCVLLIIYFFCLSPQFALAAELDPIPPALADTLDSEEWAGELSQHVDLRNPMYEPDFMLFDRSIIGRAPPGIVTLRNNVAVNINVQPGEAPGEAHTWVFDKTTSLSARKVDHAHERLELKRDERRGGGSEDDDESNSLGISRRQQSATQNLWITANTCLQPERQPGDLTTPDPPQLTLYVSTSKDNTFPGPGANPDQQKAIAFQEGAAMYNMTLKDEVYFSVAAPNVTGDFAKKMYNVEVAGSIDQPFHSFGNSSGPSLVWVDSGATTTLLITSNLTSTYEDQLGPEQYTMFAWRQGDPGVRGIRNSFCGMKKSALIGPSSDRVHISMTRRGDNNFTKQEFSVRSLNSSERYTAILARNITAKLTQRQDPKPVPGSGGQILGRVEFETKPAGACTIITNLDFCDQTAYAVPGNSKIFPDNTKLASFYDEYAQTMYDNFNKALQQIQCEASDIARYSLARNCDDCKVAYKNWICSVAIPRCDDFSSQDSWLQMRNIMAPFPDGTTVAQDIQAQYGNLTAFNSSRVPRIDDQVQPGPYKEVLPCNDLCYDIVQSCPAALGFDCPQPFMKQFKSSYAERKTTGADANVTCNYPGSAHFVSAAPTLTNVSWTAALVMLSSLVLLML